METGDTRSATRPRDAGYVAWRRWTSMSAGGTLTLFVALYFWSGLNTGDWNIVSYVKRAADQACRVMFGDPPAPTRSPDHQAETEHRTEQTAAPPRPREGLDGGAETDRREKTAAASPMEVGGTKEISGEVAARPARPLPVEKEADSPPAPFSGVGAPVTPAPDAPKVAVLEFQVLAPDVEVANAGAQSAEILIAKLQKRARGRYELLNRTQLEKIVREHGETLPEDPREALRVLRRLKDEKKIRMVDFVVLGTVGRIGRVKLIANLTALDSTMIASPEVDLASLADWDRGLEDLATRIDLALRTLPKSP